jgi:uncharacterized repeat protein (TIGR03803 family)
MSRILFCTSALVLGISAASLLTASPAMAQTATYSVVANFTDGAEGGYPVTALIQGASGNFYGSDSTGGPNNSGVVYQMTPAGTLSLLWQPPASCTTDCELPAGALTQGSDGNFYGVTETGGSNSSGSIFKITPSGTYTTLYSFTDGTDGSDPDGPLVEGSDGNLYGVANQGGLANGCPNAFGANGCGTVFKISTSGSGFKVVYTFQGTDADSGYPSGGLVQGSDGNFYGTTGGTVFKVTTGGTLTTIATITTSSDGAYFNGPLAEGADGAFYGTASESGNDGYGTIFKASASGGFTLLYTFTGQADGGAPLAGLWAGTDGNFYGTTSQGGNLSCAEGFGCGTIFAMTTAGQPTTLYTFSTQANGVLGGPAVTQGSNGSLYGTAGNGGSSSNCGDGCGTVFKATVSPAMALPIALTFSSSSVAANSPVTLSYQVNNAITITSQQCYAFVQGSATGAGTWTGKQTGSYSSSTHAYTGSASITPTAQGTYTYALTCGGTVSGFATLTVTAGSGKSSSTTTLTVTPNPVSVGQSAALKAVVTGSKGTPTGSVTFYDGSTALETISLNSSGDATLTASTNGLPTGKYSITADYGGSSTYNTSDSSAVSVTLEQAPTATTLTASPTSVTPPGDVTLTATVKRSASGATGTPTGSVTFYADGTDALATVKLNSSGVATVTATSKPYPAGKYPITAKYLGDASDVTSTSSSVTVTVQ